jgi:uncharacterized lipoprotein YddW (UPF0748 family)
MRVCPISQRLFRILVLVTACFCVGAGAQTIGVTAVAPGMIDSFQYPDDATAQRAWLPMRGSLPVAIATNDNRRVLRFPCNFANTKTERASWDSQVKLDLSSGRSLRFELLCRDTAPVSYFSLYCQSGNGWYHATFFPESTAGWNTITIDKADMSIEGQPAGWANIKAIRISAWRGQDVDTEFFLRDFRRVGVLGVDAEVAILHSAVSVRSRNAEEPKQYAEAIARHLHALEVGCAVLGDWEVTAESLRAARVVILPFNPDMPNRAADELTRYLAEGGKILACYTVPQKLRPALNLGDGKHVTADPPGKFSTIRFGDNPLPGAPTIVTQKSWNINALQPLPGQSRTLAEWFDEAGRPTGFPALIGSSNSLFLSHVLLPDDAANKQRLLLAMLGALSPAIWERASTAALERVGRVGSITSFEEAVSQISQAAGDNPRAAQALAIARTARSAVGDLITRQQFSEAIDQATMANRQLKEAFCLAQKPLAGEFRAFWCHSAFGVQGMEWDEAIQRLATNGFTAILPNMLWGGVAFYPSKILPFPAPIAQRGDQIAQCLAACRKHGLQVHVWKVNWNLGTAAPREFVDRLRKEHRLQAGADGKEKLWLCPSHPNNQNLEINSLVEVARNYAVDGIHFDYIRYPDSDHCYCAGCRDRFRRATGVTVVNWPKDLQAEGTRRNQWLEWRRSNITKVVKAVSEQARTVRPGIKISAAVFPNWVNERDNIGQDWKHWCEKGYLDFVCPMDYSPSNNNFNNLIKKQLDWAGITPCYPGIGASTAQFGADNIIEQINITRRLNTRGFVIFNYGVRESRDILPLLGAGITSTTNRQ